MPDPTSIFVASTASDRLYAKLVVAALKRVGVAGRHWEDVNAFKHSESIFDRLCKYAHGGLQDAPVPDAAVCVFTKDANSQTRDDEGNWKETVRGNVLFETGLFMGAYGQQRVLLLVEEGMDIPSDLKGLKFESFRRKDSDQEEEDYRDQFPAQRIIEWVATLPPSLGRDDDLRRLLRHVKDGCRAAALSSVLKIHCEGMGPESRPKDDLVLNALRNNKLIYPIQDAQRREVASDTVNIYRRLEIDLYPVGEKSDNRHVLDRMRAWLADHICETVRTSERPITKVAILGKPSLQGVGTEGRAHGVFESRGVRLIEYAVDALKFPVVYVNDEEYEAGNLEGSPPTVEGEVAENDNILIVHDVALTGTKLRRCKEVLRRQGKGATVEKACLIVACISEKMDSERSKFRVKDELEEDGGIQVLPLLEFDVSSASAE